jgi:hypothetical protein
MRTLCGIPVARQVFLQMELKTWNNQWVKMNKRNKRKYIASRRITLLLESQIVCVFWSIFWVCFAKVILRTRSRYSDRFCINLQKRSKEKTKFKRLQDHDIIKGIWIVLCCWMFVEYKHVFCLNKILFVYFIVHARKKSAESSVFPIKRFKANWSKESVQ